MIFLFRTNRTDFSRSIYFVQGITEAQTTNQLSGVSSGTYMVLDHMWSGEITSNLATDEEKITMTTGQDDEPHIALVCLSEI